MRRSGKRAAESPLIVLAAIALLLVSVAPFWTNFLNTETSRKVPARFSQVGGSSPTADMETAVEIAWIRQFGTSSDDWARAVAVEASGVYVAGGAGGDAFLWKYDMDGNVLWTRRFGTSSDDVATAVVANTSSVYVAGCGSEGPGFLWKYDMDGNVLWTRQVDCASAAALDASGVYVTGPAGSRASLSKYDVDGKLLWTSEIDAGLGLDSANAVALDASGVYVAGWTHGTFPGETNAGGIDAFVRRYDADGNVLWTRQFGASGGYWEFATSIASDPSGAYVVGYTDGTFPGETNAGGIDAFVRKYDASGAELWTRQFGTSGSDSAHAAAVDASGVYVAGTTNATLSDEMSAGGYDAFVRKYDFGGTEIWTRQFGSSGSDGAWGMEVDASDVYVAGATDGTFPGQTSSGGTDAFVARFAPSSGDLPPVLSVPGPIVAEATGPSGAKVDYAVTAEDDVDGSLPPVCSPASGSVFPLGTTTVTCSARDSSGNEATATFTVDVRDSRPPVLTVPADVRVEATGPSGATVTFEATATDLVDPSPVVSCSPSSGFTFGVGATTVTCAATDDAWNTATDSFTVTVEAPQVVGPAGSEIGPLVLGIAVLVIAAIVGVVVVLLTRRKNR